MASKRGFEEGDTELIGPRKQARIRACAECKKHKIRCEVAPGELSCSKCVRSGIDCVPFDLTKNFMDEDAIWKSQASDRFTKLEIAIEMFSQHSGLATSDGPVSGVTVSTKGAIDSSSLSSTIQGIATTSTGIPPLDMTRENSQEPTTEEQGLVAAPMRSLYSLTRIRNLQSTFTTHGYSRIEDDFISTGVVSLQEAKLLFARYMEQLNPLLWAGVLCPYESLDDARLSSTLLVAAILTVAALHTPNKTAILQSCYEVFVTMVCTSCLSRNRGLDDIRALSIGAFYLNNLSWKLSGQAARIATEMGLHQSFPKLLRGFSEVHEEVRLWYLIYVCDHQFSIAYGRPPVIRDDASMKAIEDFLQSPVSRPGDIRLAAQVSLFRILTEAYFLYGSDPGHALTEQDLERLRLFNVQVEQWRLSWQSRHKDIAGFGSYPSKAVVLYYHFARFQLNSLALRAIPSPQALGAPTPFVMSSDRREAANIAISSATSALALLSDEPDLHRALLGVPIFTHTMIAFCGTFLLKMAVSWGRKDSSSSSERGISLLQDLAEYGLMFPTRQVIAITQKAVDIIEQASERVGEKHLARHITTGLKNMLRRFQASPFDDGYMYLSPPSNNFHDTNQLRSATDRAATYAPGEQQAMNNRDDEEKTQASEPTDYPADVQGSYNLHNLEGTFGFGFDESYFDQLVTNDLEYWPPEL